MTLDISAYTGPRLHRRMDRTLPLRASAVARQYQGVAIGSQEAGCVLACAKPVTQGHIRRIKVP